MRRRVMSLLLVFVFLIGFAGSVQAAGFEIASINDSQLRIQSENFGADMKIMVQKGTEKYYYNMISELEHLPLQMGDGLYTIKLLKNIEGTRYKVIGKSDMNIQRTSEDVYLSSSQPIYWDNQTGMQKLSESLFSEEQSDYEKVLLAYDYMIKNIEYDYDKINYINDSYIPSIDSTINSGDGICYDYSALFAGLMRSQGVPAKLVKGYAAGVDVYHAWNEVYLNGSWKVIDTTFDAAYYQNDIKVEMFKDTLDYQKVREY